MNVEFILGESKYVDFSITSKANEPFVIASANYQLKDGSTVMSSGSCEIDGTTVSALLSPAQRGRFALEVTYTIPPETRKARVYVNVT